MSSERQYELVLFGASGYTGKLTAEHIVKYLPTDLKWALAGRSEQKLSALRDALKAINPDRKEPGIEVAELSKPDLDALAKKTKLIITTVGPYHMYGTVCFEACAENGTHYVDCTGEVPWVKDMIDKFHEKAKSTGAIMIPECGIESAPPDLQAYILAKYVRKQLNVGITDTINSIFEISGSVSGGTLLTVLTIMDSYPLSTLAASMKPYALSPIPGPTLPSPFSLLSKIIGVRSVPDLGMLTTSPTGSTDITIVNRSWGLLDGGNLYGHKFNFHEFFRVRNWFQGLLMHFSLSFGMLALMAPPVRWAVKKLVTQPGFGPSEENSKNDFIHYKAIAKTDSEPVRRAEATLKYHGGMYYLTGVLIAEAAMVILRGKSPAHELGGGVLTPATLGEEFVERLDKVGVNTSVRML
ncbi:hypothetical protein K402DRAFT_389188 [Aulographum hederae CBS 113979]|uniref:Saccharopine dehydrogenase NADP binding domain-containing protein n=1 Tax=Aulographum hederae CBS 113979 TaxID=1176131 RepID=A0A6G1HD47_9PEZI|nr:hypothetical protein K402DRAFT_389188 [Aulographum hederae CBS 113979]